MTQSTLYPLGDYVPMVQLQSIFPDVKHGDVATLRKRERELRAIATDEARPPKRGEWYLSGAIAEAHRAGNDLISAYRIAKLVKTRTVTTVEIVE